MGVCFVIYIIDGIGIRKNIRIKIKKISKKTKTTLAKVSQK